MLAAYFTAFSILLGAHALLATGPPAGGLAPSALSGDELELLRRSLRPAGLAELESHAAPLAQLPLSEVEATLDLEKARLDGHLRLIYTNRETQPLPDLVLRLLPDAPALKSGGSLKVDEVAVDGQPVHSRSHGSLLEIDLAAPLAPNSSLTLTLDFHGKLLRLRPADDALAPAAELMSQLSPGLGALGGSAPRAGESHKGYGTFAVSESGAVLLDWYPLLAARIGGAWDRSEPGPLGDPLRADVGSAIVSLSVPRGTRVIGAGVALGQHESGAGAVAAFALAGARGSLGIAVLADASQASFVEDELRPEGDPQKPAVRLRVASLHGPQGARELLTCARAALSELAPRWGPYPWSDFVLFEAPLTGGAGGVEQSGLAVLARALGGGVSNPLGTPQDATDPLPEAPGIFSFACHHEVAHQWFPGVVGSDPRTTAWLDEALAQDAAVRVAESSQGGGDAGKLAAEAAERRYVTLNYQGMRAMKFADGRVDRRTDEFKSPISYAGIIYGKAPLYLSRVRALIGSERFDAALRALRGQRAFREASGGDLLASFDKIDPARITQLDALAQRWLREQHGDEDIAPLDASDLIDGLGGGAGNVAQLAQLLRMLSEMNPNTAGFAAPNPNGPAAPRNFGSRNFGSPDDKALRRAIHDLERSMPELKQLIDQLAAQNGGQVP